MALSAVLAETKQKGRHLNPVNWGGCVLIRDYIGLVNHKSRFDPY
jgi:hypothetical protein